MRDPGNGQSGAMTDAPNAAYPRTDGTGGGIVAIVNRKNDAHFRRRWHLTNCKDCLLDIGQSRRLRMVFFYPSVPSSIKVLQHIIVQSRHHSSSLLFLVLQLPLSCQMTNDTAFMILRPYLSGLQPRPAPAFCSGLGREHMPTLGGALGAPHEAVGLSREQHHDAHSARQHCEHAGAGAGVA